MAGRQRCIESIVEEFAEPQARETKALDGRRVCLPACLPKSVSINRECVYLDLMYIALRSIRGIDRC